MNIRNHKFNEHRTRSLVKSFTYRFSVVVLDFTFIYLLTERLDFATGFVIISNVYSTIAYYFHERIWDRIRWGKKRN